jgi:benzoyl-CoA reductase subunit B
LIGIWDEQEDGTWGPKPLPQDTGVDLSNRDDALEYYVRWELNKPEWQHFYTPELKTELMLKIAREWKLNGIMLHYNRGCEGLSIGIAENRLGLMKEGFPVMSFEGNMGDEREFDEVKTMSRIDAFMETLGIEKIED